MSAPDLDVSEDDDDYDCHDFGTTVGHVSGNVFEVEKLLKKRRRGGDVEYLVRFTGYDHKHDQWLTEEDVGTPCVEEYEASRRVSRGGKSAAADPVPYVLTVCPSADAHLMSLAAAWVRELGLQAVYTLEHTHEAHGGKQIAIVKPCPEWLVVAIHSTLSQRALELEGVPHCPLHRKHSTHKRVPPDLSCAVCGRGAWSAHDADQG